MGSQVEKANTEILFDQRGFPDRFHQRNQELLKNRKVDSLFRAIQTTLPEYRIE